MIVELPYGNRKIPVRFPDGSVVAYPRDVPGMEDISSGMRQAISEPTGSPLLRDIALGKSNAVVVINDITRPAPSGLMLDFIVQELRIAGIKEDAVTVVIATGNHRPNTMDEIEQMIGRKMAQTLRVVNHLCDDEKTLSFVVETPSGLSLWLNSAVAESSVKVLTGLITPHHGAGYSGGRKSLVPGVAGLKTIAQHHSFPLRPYGPAMGWMKGNPFHEESLKAARHVGIDFIVNVVKNWKGEVVKVVAGDMEAAHEAGVQACEQSWVHRFSDRFDIVVVTPGGFPRDINLHQSQKAMSTAELVVNKEGVIVLVTECRDGIGRFGDWLKEAKKPQDVIERFKKEGFTPEHSSKAFMCARALADHPVIIACSGIEKAELEQMFFCSAPSAQDAIDMALNIRGRHSSMLVLPYAVDCVPQVSNGR